MDEKEREEARELIKVMYEGGITQADIAGMLEVSRETIRLYRKGEILPRPDMARKINILYQRTRHMLREDGEIDFNIDVDAYMEGKVYSFKNFYWRWKKWNKKQE